MVLQLIRARSLDIIDGTYCHVDHEEIGEESVGNHWFVLDD